MTERFEVIGLKEELERIKGELEYEAATRPGEGPEVERLFLKAAGKVGEVIAILAETDSIMARSGAQYNASARSP